MFTAPAGMFTAEGAAASGSTLAASLARERERAAADTARAKEAIVTKYKIAGVRDGTEARFASSGAMAAAIDGEFKARTVGLVTADEYARALADAEAAEATARQQAAAGRLAAALRAPAAAAAVPSGAAGGGAVPAASAAPAAPTAAGVKRKLLSFDPDDEEEEGADAGASRRPVSRPPAAASSAAAADDGDGGGGGGGGGAKRARVMAKDPSVATAFLPDAAREEREARLREELKREWLAAQDAVRAEKVEVVFSYWDGSGHRRALTLPKGTTVGKFLERVRQELCGQFPDLQRVGSDELLYVKEDLIIPHGLSFYDLISTKARGKSGPLFQFDVHDDVRLKADARVEKDESHPGKIVLRRWYERNKHIFPASRWELYDPAVVRDDGYTTHGRVVTTAKG